MVKQYIATPLSPTVSSIHILGACSHLIVVVSWSLSGTWSMLLGLSGIFILVNGIARWLQISKGKRHALTSWGSGAAVLHEAVPWLSTRVSNYLLGMSLLLHLLSA